MQIIIKGDTTQEQYDIIVGLVGRLQDHLQKKGITIKYTGYNRIDILFEQFWELYPKRIAKIEAKKAYNKIIKGNKRENIQPIEHETIMEGVNKYIKHIKLSKTDNRYIQYPSTWLNGGGRDNEYRTNTISSNPIQTVKEVIPDMTPEQRSEAKRKLQEMKEKMFNHNSNPGNPL